MFKRIVCLILVMLLSLSFTGCKKKEETLSVEVGSTPTVSSEPEELKGINPLTGVKITDESIALQRPVAVMVNNADVAQPVQTGLTKADIIYETEVEGGVTRLLAVFQDIKSVEKVGTIRSARYDYIDIALGHNALYVHHGQDNYHAKPHLADVDRLIVSESNAGVRISNGLATEHTLYGYGDKIWEKFKSMDIETTVEKAEPWQKFAEEDMKFENKADEISVPFSYSYNTVMKYDGKTEKYTRFSDETERKDYYNKESITVDNVFVLETKITPYPGCSDRKGHMKVYLTSGEGYYFTKGTYTKIKWSKGDSENGFSFTTQDGEPLTVNPGKSWVCITRNEPVMAEAKLLNK